MRVLSIGLQQREIARCLAIDLQMRRSPISSLRSIENHPPASGGNERNSNSMRLPSRQDSGTPSPGREDPGDSANHGPRSPGTSSVPWLGGAGHGDLGGSVL